jgi:glycopeptide antibiotics resistance protein
MKNTDRIIKNSFGTYIAILLLITVIRPWNMDYHFMGGHLNLTLLSDYRYVLHDGATRFIYLFFGNIIWFVPFGYYIVAYKRKSLLTAILIGFALSLVIEITQFVLGSGVSEIDDIILNTFGCFIGGITAGKKRVNTGAI